MKKIFFTVILLFAGVTLFSQQKTEEKKKAIKVETKEVKTANRTMVYSNQDSNSTEKNESKNNEPVIIQHLEYNAKDVNSGGQTKNEVNTSDGNINTTDRNKVIPFEEKSVDEKIAILDSYIGAVKIKIEYVRNNPEEDKKAKETGWYDEMNENINNAETQKQELINSKK